MVDGQLSLCDGRTLSYSGFVAPPSQSNQYAQLRLDGFGPTAFEVANGRTFDDFLRRGLPSGWKVSDVERYSRGDSELGIATLTIAQEAGFPSRVIKWGGLELQDGVIRTAVQDLPRRSMLQLLQRVDATSSGAGIVVKNPIDASVVAPRLFFDDVALGVLSVVESRAYGVTAARIPTNSGQKVKGGHLYRLAEEPESPRMLANSSTIATFHLHEQGSVNGARAEELYRQVETVELEIR